MLLPQSVIERQRHCHWHQCLFLNSIHSRLCSMGYLHAHQQSRMELYFYSKMCIIRPYVYKIFRCSTTGHASRPRLKPSTCGAGKTKTTLYQGKFEVIQTYEYHISNLGQWYSKVISDFKLCGACVCAQGPTAPERPQLRVIPTKLERGLHAIRRICFYLDMC